MLFLVSLLHPLKGKLTYHHQKDVNGSITIQKLNNKGELIKSNKFNYLHTQIMNGKAIRYVQDDVKYPLSRNFAIRDFAYDSKLDRFILTEEVISYDNYEINSAKTNNNKQYLGNVFVWSLDIGMRTAGEPEIIEKTENSISFLHDFNAQNVRPIYIHNGKINDSPVLKSGESVTLPCHIGTNYYWSLTGKGEDRNIIGQARTQDCGKTLKSSQFGR